MGKFLYLEHVTKCLQRYGVWADWNNPYLTLDPEYEAAQVAGTAFLVYPFRRVKSNIKFSSLDVMVYYRPENLWLDFQSLDYCAMRALIEWSSTF